VDPLASPPPARSRPLNGSCFGWLSAGGDHRPGAEGRVLRPWGRCPHTPGRALGDASGVSCAWWVVGDLLAAAAVGNLMVGGGATKNQLRLRPPSDGRWLPSRGDHPPPSGLACGGFRRHQDHPTLGNHATTTHSTSEPPVERQRALVRGRASAGARRAGVGGGRASGADVGGRASARALQGQTSAADVGGRSPSPGPRRSQVGVQGRSPGKPSPHQAQQIVTVGVRGLGPRGKREVTPSAPSADRVPQNVAPKGFEPSLPP
jgi:hypothetical protein